jgi:hypothetical protein
MLYIKYSGINSGQIADWKNDEHIALFFLMRAKVP